MNEQRADPIEQAAADLSDAFDVCSFAELKSMEAMAFTFRHRERGVHDVAVFWDGESVYSLNDWCTHADGFLNQGEIRRRKVICPIHGAPFDLLTGRCIDRTVNDTRAYKAEVRDGRVWVHLPDEERWQRGRRAVG